MYTAYVTPALIIEARKWLEQNYLKHPEDYTIKYTSASVEVIFANASNYEWFCARWVKPAGNP